MHAWQGKKQKQFLYNILSKQVVMSRLHDNYIRTASAVLQGQRSCSGKSLAYDHLSVQQISYTTHTVHQASNQLNHKYIKYIITLLYETYRPKN
jgi:hypothetical protein